MTDEQRQRLSALVDGEGTDLDRQLAITAAMDDHDLAACWERYVTIGRLIRGESISLAVRGLAPRIAAMTAAPFATDSASPAVRSPAGLPGTSPDATAPGVRAATPAGTASVGSPVVASGRYRRRRSSMPASGRSHRHQAARSLIGLAVAAGVALMAVVVGPRLLLDTAPTMPTLASGVATGAAGHSVLERWRVGTDGSVTIDSPRLDDLLVTHRERAAVHGLTGFMPHATLVGFSGGR